MDFRRIDPLLEQSLEEDIGRGDLTTRAIVESAREKVPSARATVSAKEPFVICGWPVFVRVFELLGGVSADVYFDEGASVGLGQAVGTLQSDVSTLLQGERVALNLLQRLSGIATLTRSLVDQIRHTSCRILDTRKTTPLWRELEKYAVRVGGGVNHRHGLDDGVLIKENHVAVAGGIEQAVTACRRVVHHLHKVEVEVRNLDELDSALRAGADVVMLDNMSPELVREAVERTGRRALVEVSGGVTSENVVAYAEAGADLLSVGRLTHSFRSVDISMLLETV